MANLANKTNRLALSALDLKRLTGWPDAVIEDYINILSDYIRLANAVDDNSEVDVDLMVEIGLGQNQAIASLTRAIDSALKQQIVPTCKSPGQENPVMPIASSIPRQTIRNLKSDVSVIGTATISDIQTDGAIVNTNTPAGATAYALELKDESGVTLGYLPVYGSLW